MPDNKIVDINKVGSSTNIVIQNPGEDVKPVVPAEEVGHIVRRLYGLNVTKFSSLNSYDDVNFYIEVDQKNHTNPYLGDVDKSYVLKVFNSMDSQRPDLIDAQHSFMAHLKKNGISVQEPIKDLDGNVWSIQKIPSNETGKSSSHWVEIRTFLPGTIITAVPHTPDLMFKVGVFLGRMRLAVQNFKHPFYVGYYNLWSVTYVPKLRDYLFCVTDSDRKDLVEDILDTYNREVIPQYSKLPMGCIHGDTNEQNILVQKELGQEHSSTEVDQYFISGILDYTDVSESYLIIDLAISIAYLMIDADDDLTMEIGRHMIAGYKKHVTLSRTEVEVLPVMVAARMCQSFVLGLHANHVNPDNTYVLTTQKGWPVLRKFWDTKDSLLVEWERVMKSSE